MDRIEKLNAYLKDKPGDAFLRHALALEYIKLGRDEDARALFESIIHDQPSYTGTYYHLGKLLERSGETEKAVNIYKQGMEESKKAGEMQVFGELKGALEENEQ